MILFGLYTGQRLGDIATLRWNNLDLVRGELRLSTRKTDKTMVLPLARPSESIWSLCRNRRVNPLRRSTQKHLT